MRRATLIILAVTGGTTAAGQTWIGHVDYVGADYIAGWACDQDHPERETFVRIWVDNFEVAAFRCWMPGVSCGGYYKRFQGAMPQVDPGLYSVTVRASEFDTGAPVSLALSPGAIQYRPDPPPDSNDPRGYVDAITPQYIAGWAWDPNGCPAIVDIYVMFHGQGDFFRVATVNADQHRPDSALQAYCGGNVGFSYSFPASLFPPGHHNVWCVVRNIGAGGTTGQWGLDRVLIESWNPASSSYGAPPLLDISGPPGPPPGSTVLQADVNGMTGIGAVTSTGPHAGMPAIVFGTSEALSVAWTDGAQPYCDIGLPGMYFAGHSLAAIGDTDGDGVSEFVAGDPAFNGSRGRYVVVSGQSGIVFRDFTAATPGDRLAESLAAIGDLTGDGKQEWIVGSAGAFTAGIVEIVSGALNAPPHVRSHLGTWYGLAAGARFGASVCGLGDVDGDSVPDYAVGAPGASRVYLFSGASGNPIGAPLLGSSPGSQLGSALAGPGDMDGDGRPDLAVGEAGVTDSGILAGQSPAVVGRVRVLSGLGLGELWSRPGNAGARLGERLAAAGDATGDGIPDLFLGETLFGHCADLQARLVAGSSCGAICEALQISAPGPAVQVGNGGDVNANGIADLLLGGVSLTCHSTPGAGTAGAAAALSVGASVPVAVRWITATEALADRIDISWEPLAGGLGYKVFRDGALIATAPGHGSRSHTDTPPPGTYCYSVAAFNGNGDGAMSAMVTGRRPPPGTAAVSVLGAGQGYAGRPAPALACERPVLGTTALITVPRLPASAFFTDFDGGVPPEIGGAGLLDSVYGFNGLGLPGNRFGVSLLRNSAGGAPAPATTLTLSSLPPHTSVSIGFLLAVIDSWDSFDGNGSPDWFHVSVDGSLVFRTTFNNASGTFTYEPPAGGAIGSGGFGWSSWADRAFDMGLEPALQDLPHTAPSLTITFYAGGAGWQGGGDESFGIDNLRVDLGTVLLKTGFDDGLPPQISGAGTLEPVQGLAGLGHEGNRFCGRLLRNDTLGNPATPTVATFTGLPPHTGVSIGFLLAAIDTWDGGTSGTFAPDWLFVAVDGSPSFIASFNTTPGAITHPAPTGGAIGTGTFGWSPWPEQAFDFSLEPGLQRIPHGAGTLTVSIYAGGAGWQGGADESWAIDNLRIALDGVPGHPSAGGLLAASLPPAVLPGISVPCGQFFELACPLSLDPPSVGIVAILAPGNGPWRFAVPVPDLPALNGVQIALQGGLGPDSGGLVTTPGLALTFGTP